MKFVAFSFRVYYARGEDTEITYLTGHHEKMIVASTTVLFEFDHGLMITQNTTQEEAMSKSKWVEPVSFADKIAAEVPKSTSNSVLTEDVK